MQPLRRVLPFVLFSFMAIPFAKKTDAAADTAAKKVVSLTPLPDPVGFAGMFAAVLKGRLVAGGGSHFPDKPLWLEGQKAYSDRVFALDRPRGAWRVLAGRLPHPMAHFAAAPVATAVYLAGGIGGDGRLLAEAFELQLAGDDVVIRPLAPLPKPLAYSAGVVADGRFYVAGGQQDVAKKEAVTEVWSLDVGKAGAPWRREPDFPGSGTFVGAMAAVGPQVIFIGGVGYDANGKAVQSNKTYTLPAGAKAWVELPEMPEPRVGAVTPCPVVAGRHLVVMGGYASAFPGERRDHPGFSRQTLIYDLESRTWRNGPVLPYVPPVDKDSTSDVGPAPMVAAPGVVWNDLFVAVSGEVRASVRTPAVVGLPLSEL